MRHVQMQKNHERTTGGVTDLHTAGLLHRPAEGDRLRWDSELQREREREIIDESVRDTVGVMECVRVCSAAYLTIPPSHHPSIQFTLNN